MLLSVRKILLQLTSFWKFAHYQPIAPISELLLKKWKLDVEDKMLNIHTVTIFLTNETLKIVPIGQEFKI